MTIEQKMIFGLEDVRGLRVECARCKVVIGFNLDESFKLPITCPSCQETWKDNFTETERASSQAIDQFIGALKNLRRVQSDLKGKPVILRFEFDVPAWLAGRASGSA